MTVLNCPWYATTQTARASTSILENWGCGLVWRYAMKWAGMYFVGFVILIGGVLAALWKLGVLQTVDTSWIVIGVVILLGLGLMISVAYSGTKENIQIDRK
jgi:hypothetical protein